MKERVIMPSLFLTNSLTRKKEQFIPLREKNISLYVCGITPYDYAHVGHGRCYVTFDILFRLFATLDNYVTYVRNFTDIDDKLLEKAQLEFGNELYFDVVAKRFEMAFHQDMEALNCLSPVQEPTVTENIESIITFIEGLLKEDVAYQLDSDVYFDISKFPTYGKLSGRSQEELLSGARIAIDERKRNPNDFALWKGNDQGKFWQSPWGFGRPGWHIECSTFVKEYLGATIDIHGGGMDLIFPHHENEIAQSESLVHKPLARYWVHNAFVTINKEKMSKSLKNFFTLRDIFKKYDPMVLRFYFLQHHYRSPIDFSFEALDAAKKAYTKLVSHFSTVKTENKGRFHMEHGDALLTPIYEALCDDLNTPKALGLIFDYLPQLQTLGTTNALVAHLLQAVLGLTLDPLPEEIVEITPEIQNLLSQREEARAEKNWKLADELRDKLRELGFEVHDNKAKK